MGIKTELHISFVLLLLLIAASGNSLLAFSSVIFSLLHELAHGYTAKSLGYTPNTISAGLFGGVLHLSESVIKQKHQLFIHLAGPGFNILMAACFYGCYLLFQIAWLEELILANLVLAFFNLMPFYPLDGGKIISLYLSFFFGFHQANRLSQFFSRLFSVFLFFLGIYLVQYNVMNLLISALAFNLALVSRNDNRFVFYKLTKHIEAESKNPSCKMVVCKSNTPAIRVLRTYRPSERRMFTIVNHKGGYKGQLSEEEVLFGIYDCGIYADFYKLLAWKRNRTKRNGE